MSNDESKSPDATSHTHLSDYVDGLMPEAERDAFDARLAADPELRSELDGFETTLEALKRLPKSSAPDGFRLDVYAKVRPRLRASDIMDIRTGRFPYEAAFNIVIIVLLIGLYVSALGSDMQSTGADEVVHTVTAEEVQSVLKRHGELKATVTPEGARYHLSVDPKGLASLKRALVDLPGLQIVSMRPEGDQSIVVVLVLKGR